MTDQQIEQLVDYLKQKYQPLLKSEGRFLVYSRITNEKGIVSVSLDYNDDIRIWMYSPNSYWAKHPFQFFREDLIAVDTRSPLISSLQDYIQQNFYTMPLYFKV